MNQNSAHKEEKLLEKKFEAFFMHYSPKVKSFAWKLVKSEDDAEDVTQETFLKLWKTPDLWNKDTVAFDNYLYKMMKNKVMDIIVEVSGNIRYSMTGDKCYISPL